jgi:G3E family GTPase
LSALNPTAKLITTTNSTVQPSEVLQTGLWNTDKAQGSAAWVQLMRQNPADSTPLQQQQQHQHNHECCGSCDHSDKPAAAAAAADSGVVTAGAVRSTDAYGVSHFVYRARWPFHPGRLHNFMVSFFVLQEPDWEKLLQADREVDREDDASDSEDQSEELDLLQTPASENNPSSSSSTDTQGGTSTAQQLQEVAGARRAVFEARFGLLLRSKGFVWLATRGDHIGEWSQAGSLLSFSTGERDGSLRLYFFLAFHTVTWTHKICGRSAVTAGAVERGLEARNCCLCTWRPHWRVEPGRQPAQLLHRWGRYPALHAVTMMFQ